MTARLPSGMLPADLPDAARAYLEAFPAGEIVAFPIDPIDRLGIPVWIVALFPDDEPALRNVMPYGVGYGADAGQAILGAMGEIAEMAFPALSLSRRRKTRGSYADLVASLGPSAVADPLTLCLPAGSDVGRDTVLEWVEAVRRADGSTVLVPIDLAAYNRSELYPYAMRNPDAPRDIRRERIEPTFLGIKMDALLAYESQLGFQFGGAARAREQLAGWANEGFAELPRDSL